MITPGGQAGGDGEVRGGFVKGKEKEAFANPRRRSREQGFKFGGRVVSGEGIGEVDAVEVGVSRRERIISEQS